MSEYISESECTDKRVRLFLMQKETLDALLKTNAITKEQYGKSLGDLTEKMGMWDVLKSIEG